jgi:hypothetical protein
MVYLPVSKFEGESGPRFLPVLGKGGEALGSALRTAPRGKALNPDTTTSADISCLHLNDITGRVAHPFRVLCGRVGGDKASKKLA